MSGRGERVARRRFLLATGGVTLALLDLRHAAARTSAAASAANQPSETIRVLLRRASGELTTRTVGISCDGLCTVRDRAGGDGGDAAAGEVLTVERDGAGLWITFQDGKRRGPFGGPLEITAKRGALLYDHRGEATRPNAYRGAFQIAPSTDAGHLVVLNQLALDEYLKGVVPVELPTTFGPEPARAQAVAARGFALARRARSAHAALLADVCDGPDCQSYGGLAVEHALSSAAVDATRGMTLSRDGAPFEPFYSSACGGHTEDPSGLSGAIATQSGNIARHAVPDGEFPEGVDLGTERGAAIFYGRGWDSHCSATPSYRWNVHWDRGLLETLLDVGLRRLSGSPLVSPGFPPDARIGRLIDLVVADRSATGRALALRIEGSNGAWTIRGGWTIRSLLRSPGPNATPLPSTAFTLQAEPGSGTLAAVKAIGAGAGHGVGMCQWGTRGLASRGAGWEAILAHYYPAAKVGAIPR